MKSARWSMKYVVLPLSPFFVGILFRFFRQGNLEFAFVSPAELGFSMAMLSLILTTQASQISDKAVRDDLHTALRVGIVVYLALFAVAKFLDVDLQYTLRGLAAINPPAAGSPLSPELMNYQSHLKDCDSIMSRVRLTTLLLSVVGVVSALATSRRYKLEGQS
jgi:hypothetical protein